MSQEAREQEKETIDKITLCYLIPKLQKLVQQAPQCGEVLTSTYTFNKQIDNLHYPEVILYIINRKQ